MPPCGMKLPAALHPETVFWQMIPWDRVNERRRCLYRSPDRVKLYVYDHRYTHSINFNSKDFHGGWSRLYLHDDSRRSGEIPQCVNAKQLMLIPKTIREVECHLLLLETGRAVLVLRQWPSATYYLGLYQALSLLARLLRKGHLGKAMVAHVLTMLGGPMERMESWGPPGRNKRRPCKVRVCYPDGFSSSGEREYVVYTALLGANTFYGNPPRTNFTQYYYPLSASGAAPRSARWPPRRRPRRRRRPCRFS